MMDNDNLNIESDEYLYKNLEEDANKVVEEYIPDEDVDSKYMNEKNNIEPEEEKTNLGMISLAILGVSIVMGILGDNLSLGSVVSRALEGFCSICGVVSFILMIYTRIKYRKDIWAKITMWLFIVGFVFTVVAVLLLIWACSSCVGSMG